MKREKGARLASKKGPGPHGKRPREGDKGVADLRIAYRHNPVKDCDTVWIA